MRMIDITTHPLRWVMASLLVIVAAGCGDGDDNPVAAAPAPVAPTVSYTIPLNVATAVPTNRKATAVFSEAMDAATITAAGTFTLRETNPPSTAVNGTVTYEASSRSAIFTPAAPLSNTTGYTATITTAAKNVAGTALANERTWTFTTGAAADNTAPLLLSTNPSDTQIAVPSNQIITASFNEPMDATTICGPAGLTAACPVASFTVTCGAPCVNPAGVVTYSGTTASFTPNSPLEASTTYTATITGNDLAGNALVAGAVTNPWAFTTGAAGVVHLGPAPVVLGAIQPYGVLTNTSITLGGGPGSTTGFRIIGDVAIFPAGACNGCDNTTVNGQIVIGTVPASDAMVALDAAYNDAIGRTANVCTLIGSGVLTTNPAAACGGAANGTFTPGLYWSATSIEIPAGGTITLDAQNDPTAVFIFQSESTINSIGGNTHVILANQAQAKNVFWVAKSSATIGGVASDFAGTVIALVAVTVNTGTSMAGRALARGAAVTVQDGALITVPAP